MASSSVVVLEPGGKGVASGLVAGKGLPKGPVGLEGAVAAFDIAVLPGAVRSDEHLPSFQIGDDGSERGAVSAGGVVGHDPLHAGDDPAGEVNRGPFQERGAGGCGFVVVDSAVASRESHRPPSGRRRRRS